MNDMSDFEAVEADLRRRHDRVVARSKSDVEPYQRPSVLSQVSMSREQKERFTRVAKEHGLSLSALFRLATDEYIHTHGWE